MTDESNPFAKTDEEVPASDPFAKTEEDKIEEPNPFEAKVEEAVEVKEEVKEVKQEIKLGVRESARQRILEEYGGLESNVPINSSYWNR